uniref:Uncharacterized protein n=1 Tax=Anguilla anguilla TaxID=7936 RepID=A0A0E9XWN5_ANGAN
MAVRSAQWYGSVLLKWQTESSVLSFEWVVFMFYPPADGKGSPVSVEAH